MCSRCRFGVLLVLVVSYGIAALGCRSDAIAADGGDPGRGNGGGAGAEAGTGGEPRAGGAGVGGAGVQGGDGASAGRPSLEGTVPDGRDTLPADDGQDEDVGANDVEGLVRADQFTSLVFELDAVEGSAPSADAQAMVIEQLTGLIDKPQGISVRLDQSLVAAADEHSWTDEELRTLAEQTQTLAPESERVVVHVLALDGHKDTDTAELTTLGLSWGHDTVVLFSSTIEASCTTRSARAINTTRFCDQAVASIWLHELGHLLGLVNLGLDMQHAHEDPEHAAHCSDPNCLMYWAYHRTGVVDRLRDRFDSGELEPPALDVHCQEDLSALRDAP